MVAACCFCGPLATVMSGNTDEVPSEQPQQAMQAEEPPSQPSNQGKHMTAGKCAAEFPDDRGGFNGGNGAEPESTSSHDALLISIRWWGGEGAAVPATGLALVVCSSADDGGCKTHSKHRAGLQQNCRCSVPSVFAPNFQICK